MAPVPGIPILTAVPPDPAQGSVTAINKKNYIYKFDTRKVLVILLFSMPFIKGPM